MGISYICRAASKRKVTPPAVAATVRRATYRSRVIAAAFTALGMSVLPLSPAAGATHVPRGAIAVRVAGVPADASEILVRVESPLTHMGVPRRLDLYPVAAVPATGASTTVTVPRSRRLSSIAAAQHGVVNLAVDAEASGRTYERWVPVHLGPHGTAAVTVTGIDRASWQHPPAQSEPAMPPDWLMPCKGYRVGSTEGVTRIGELHIAHLAGAFGDYDSTIKTDDTVTAGVSATGEPGSFKASGSVSLSNSVSSGGGFGAGSGFNKYVDGHVYYGKFRWAAPGCTTHYTVGATSSPGDAWAGPSNAPQNPFGSCHNDPNGLATVNHVMGGRVGHYHTSGSKAKTYQGAFDWFGFSFGAADGFTHDVSEQWYDRDSKYDTFVCGNVNPVQDSSIFWNQPH